MITMHSYCLLILALLGLVNAEKQHYISETTASYASTSTLCTLATPPIVYSQNGDSVAINISSIHDPKGLLRKGQAVWIGYYEAYATFLYKGCTLPSNIHSSVHINMTKDPGQCLSKCRTVLIGLQETTCHCIIRIPAANQLLEDGCNASCSKPSGVLCGSIDYVSVYQKVMHSVTDDYGDNDCLKFDLFFQMYSWTPCSNYLQSMCQNYDNTTLVYDKYLPWAHAMQMCLKNSTYPVNSLQNHLTKYTGGSLWAGNIRSFSIFPINDDMNRAELYRQGFVKFVNGRMDLLFGPMQQEMHAICVKETPFHTRSTSHSVGQSLVPTKETTNSDSTDGHTLLTSTTKRIEQTFTTSVNTSVTTGASGDGYGTEVATETGSSKVVLFTVIPVSLLLITGVVVFILWKRRYITVCKRTEKNIHRQTISTSATDIRLESEHNYQDLNLYQNDPGPMSTYDSLQAVSEDVPSNDYYLTPISRVSKVNANSNHYLNVD